MSWQGLGRWWLDELAGDSAYEDVVTPLLMEVLTPEAGRLYGDIGCGEGRVMRSLSALGVEVIGVDVSQELVARAGPGVVVAQAPPLPIRDRSLDGVYLVLVLEHIPDHRKVLSEGSRVVRAGGKLAVVMNHPVWTAPESTPIEDDDGEILWRPGKYFSEGISEVPAGEDSLVFHHRSMASLLQTAADSGWSLERIVERPHHDLEGQEGIPRLLGCGWRLLP